MTSSNTLLNMMIPDTGSSIQGLKPAGLKPVGGQQISSYAIPPTRKAEVPLKTKDSSIIGRGVLTPVDLSSNINWRADKNFELIKAARDGNVKDVERLLNLGADPLYRDSDAMQHAAENGHDLVVKMLIDAGADPRANDDNATKWARLKTDSYGKIIYILAEARKSDHIDKYYDRVAKLLTDLVHKIYSGQIDKQLGEKEVIEILIDNTYISDDPDAPTSVPLQYDNFKRYLRNSKRYNYLLHYLTSANADGQSIL